MSTKSHAHLSADTAKELFEFREFEQDAFRSMEVQICGETRTVQFTTSDHGGDHPTSPSVAIDWSAAIGLASWIISRAGDQTQRSAGNAEENAIYEALTIAADVVCELKCPSVWKTGEPQPHSDECKKVRAARSAWMDHCAVQDVVASGGLFPDEPQAAPDWQPIDTAPEDHFPLLVYGKHGRLVAFRDVTWEWWPVPAKSALGYVPTHWMQLPASPVSRPQPRGPHD